MSWTSSCGTHIHAFSVFGGACLFMHVNTSVPCADDWNSVAWCDSCFAGLASIVQSSLEYIPLNETSTFETYGNSVADQQDASGRQHGNAVVGDIGQRRAFPLLSFQRQYQCNFQEYGYTTHVVIDWYTSQGIDPLAIVHGDQCRIQHRCNHKLGFLV